jgi:hypothetical protein
MNDPILVWPCGSGHEEDAGCMIPASQTGCSALGAAYTPCHSEDISMWDDIYCFLLNCQWCCIYA